MSGAPHMATSRRHCLVTGKQVHPEEGFGFGIDGCVFYSFEGYRKHSEAVRLLATGEPPEGCHECGCAPADSLNEKGRAAFYLHYKDGLYQALCRSCSDRYQEQTKERYKDTPYGAMRKL